MSEDGPGKAIVLPILCACGAGVGWGGGWGWRAGEGGGIFHTSGVSAEGTLISASAPLEE